MAGKLNTCSERPSVNSEDPADDIAGEMMASSTEKRFFFDVTRRRQTTPAEKCLVCSVKPLRATICWRLFRAAVFVRCCCYVSAEAAFNVYGNHWCEHYTYLKGKQTKKMWAKRCAVSGLGGIRR